jgi:hypothetical protein
MAWKQGDHWACIQWKGALSISERTSFHVRRQLPGNRARQGSAWRNGEAINVVDDRVLTNGSFWRCEERRGPSDH